MFEYVKHAKSRAGMQKTMNENPWDPGKPGRRELQPSLLCPVKPASSNTGTDALGVHGAKAIKITRKKPSKCICLH